MRRFHKFYLTTLLTIALLGPAFWLLFTSDGQRQFDIVLLKVTRGAGEMNIDLAQLRPQVREETLIKALPDITLACADRNTDLGSRVCEGPIAAFNGNPSRHAAFYFDENGLRAMKVGYQRAYHRRLLEQLYTTIGPPVVDPQAQEGVGQWPVGGGILIMLKDERLELDEEPALMWLAVTPG